jgi:hypothetical protein
MYKTITSPYLSSIEVGEKFDRVGAYYIILLLELYTSDLVMKSHYVISAASFLNIPLGPTHVLRFVSVKCALVIIKDAIME